MVLYTPPLQNLPQPVTPPNRDRPVIGVQPVGDRRRQDQPDRRKEGRTLRHRLLDLLMEEVDNLPDLSVPQKQRIRRNLDRLAEKPPAAPTPMERGPPLATPLPVEAGPPPVVDTLSLPGSDQTISVLADDVISAQEVGLPRLADGMDATQLAQEIERLLALHSEQAVKIASYIQALRTVTPNDHQVDLDI